MRDLLLPLAQDSLPKADPAQWQALALEWFNRLNALALLGQRGILPWPILACDLQPLAQSHARRFDLLNGPLPAKGLTEVWEVVCTQGPTLDAPPEALGWLHQYFQSAHKTKVQRALGGARKSAKTELAALTQIFTPSWIVQMLLESTLGRMWRGWHPNSTLKLKWEGRGSPSLAVPLDQLLLSDPACGAGHMLLQAFDMFWQLHEEIGTAPQDAARVILTENLLGFDIDPMVLSLAQMALLLKVAEKLGPRAMLGGDLQPKLILLHDIHFSEAEIASLAPCKAVAAYLQDLAHGAALGSLMRVTFDPAKLAALAQGRLPKDLRQRLLQAETIARHLARRPHVILANPPYLGARDMDPRLMAAVKAIGGKPRFDLFAAMMLRFHEMLAEGGMAGLLTPNVWLYIATYEGLRQQFCTHLALQEVIELPLAAFGDATVQLCAFSYLKGDSPDPIRFTRLVDCQGEMEAMGVLAHAPKAPATRHMVLAKVLAQMPSTLFAYWLGPVSQGLLATAPPLAERATPRQGLATTDNARFVRLWHELPIEALAFGIPDRQSAQTSGKRWFPYNKGGEYRRWYGNADHVVDWGNDGAAIKAEVLRKYPYLGDNPDFVTKNQSCYFKPAVTWTYINSTNLGVRHADGGFIFDVAGSSVFPKAKDHDLILGLLSSKVAKHFIDAINPTLNIQAGSIGAIPLPKGCAPPLAQVQKAVALARQDWNESEMSWDFAAHPLLQFGPIGLPAAWTLLRDLWQRRVTHMRRLEGQNNKAFIQAYGLQDELSPKVALSEVTLFANPVWRYGAALNQPERERRFLRETFSALLHYALGCLFGRYALGRKGLILAGGLKSAEDYARVTQGRKLVLADNMLPLHLGGAEALLTPWLGEAFGASHLEQTLAFLQQGLGQSLDQWLQQQAMADHSSMTQRRPYLWQFGPAKDSFRVVFAMHRYQPKLMAQMHESYLVPELARRADQVQMSDAKARPKALAQWQTLQAWQQAIAPVLLAPPQIDLEDGVAHNHALFGAALVPLR